MVYWQYFSPKILLGARPSVFFSALDVNLMFIMLALDMPGFAVVLFVGKVRTATFSQHYFQP